MARAVGFYRALGFDLARGGETAEFTSVVVGDGHLNLIGAPPEARWGWWGRARQHVRPGDHHPPARAFLIEPATGTEEAASTFPPSVRPLEAGLRRYVVTGDKDPLDLKVRRGVRIVRPARFLQAIVRRERMGR